MRSRWVFDRFLLVFDGLLLLLESRLESVDLRFEFVVAHDVSTSDRTGFCERLRCGFVIKSSPPYEKMARYRTGCYDIFYKGCCPELIEVDEYE